MLQAASCGRGSINGSYIGQKQPFSTVQSTISVHGLAAGTSYSSALPPMCSELRQKALRLLTAAHTYVPLFLTGPHPFLALTSLKSRNLHRFAGVDVYNALEDIRASYTACIRATPRIRGSVVRPYEPRTAESPRTSLVRSSVRKEQPAVGLSTTV